MKYAHIVRNHGRARMLLVLLFLQVFCSLRTVCCRLPGPGQFSRSEPVESGNYHQTGQREMENRQGGRSGEPKSPALVYWYERRKACGGNLQHSGVSSVAHFGILHQVEGLKEHRASGN